MKDILGFALLVFPGLLPALAVCGIRPSAVFAVPLLGAMEAAVAALAMFVLPGSFGAWYATVAIAANLVALLVLSRADRAVSPIGRWAEGAGVVVVAAGVLWPLLALNAPIIGYDAQAIWLLHAAMVSGGHSLLLSDLTNPQYGFSNPDYPPLVPASVAVVYTVRGAASMHVGVVVVAMLNASAVGLAATGLLRVVPASVSFGRRAVAYLVVFVFAGAVFGIAGVAGVSGYADLLWSAATVAGTVYGLVLPLDRFNLAISGLCISIAGMTKNEGLVTAIFLAAAVAWRYAWPLRSRAGWMRAVLVAAAALAVPVAWAETLRSRGISDSFFSSTSPESVSSRLRATVPGMWIHLHLAPIALGVALIGWLLLSGERNRLRLGHPVLLWLVAAWSVAAIGATYVFGNDEIHWWLRSSANRTTIFTNCILICDLTIWALILVSGQRAESGGRHFQRDVEAPTLTR